MTGPPFPELRILALLGNIEAVAQNVEDAVVFEIGVVIGFNDPAATPFSASVDCTFDIGDGFVNDLLEDLLGKMCAFFNLLIERVIGVINLLQASILGFLEGIVQAAIDGFLNLIDTITTTLAAAISAVVSALESVVRSIVDTLSAVVGAVVDQVRSVINTVEGVLVAIFNRISTVVSAIIDKIGDVFTALLNVATGVLAKIRDGISAAISALVDTTELVFSRVGGALTDLINVLTGVAESGLGRVREVIENIPSTLREIFEEAREFAGDVIGKPLENMGEILITQLEKFFEDLVERLDLNPNTVLTEFLTGIGLPADEVARIAGPANSAMPKTFSVFTVAVAAMIPFLIPPMVTTILSPALDQLRQEVAQRVVPTLVPPNDAIVSFVRGNMTEDEFRSDLGEAGYSRRRQDILLRSSRRLVDLGQTFRWWLRGLISEEDLNDRIIAQNISIDDRELFKQSVFFIPPVGDLIQMAVREVFSPDIRERFGQDEGFPTEFAKFGAQQGISEEWAKNYWAAHWALPSPQQGFEMLHRKVVDPETLDLLLRAQDVMPFWRERLVEIAFRPLTRVDLRRMHKLGIFDEDQLQVRYEDLGFSPENAAHMVTFTVAFNADDTTEAEAEIEGLTRATVVNMMEDGILEESEALEILQLMGLSDKVASLFIDQRKLEIQRRDRLALIESVIQLIGGGLIDLPEAQDSLARIGLTAAEIAKATQRILAKISGRDRLPSLAQLRAMLTLEIIDEELWTQTMGGLGFSDEWVGRILELDKAGGEA